MNYWGLLGALTLGMAISGQPGSAQEDRSPVVVELFTSQGCSSCPPADALLHKLSKRDDVIALALHVDYWDYIGWKDKFALAGHTKRQKAYARTAGRRMIYTPQMIINGTDHVVGTHPMDVAELIDRHEETPAAVTVSVTQSGDTYTVNASALNGNPGSSEVMLVRYEPEAVVEITRGENAGRELTYTNIVRGWETLGVWDGNAPFEARVEIDPPAVVFVQSAGFGPILAADVVK